MRNVLVATILCVCGATIAGAAEDATDNFLEAITKGTFSLNLRYRYEQVDQDGFDDQGKASTLRTAFGYRTQWWYGFQVYAEFEDIHDIGYGDDHNNAGAGSLWNGVTDRPVVADPELTEINQAYLGLRPAESFVIRAGLQEIVIDNSRFVGNVGWRQNHQSFESATLTYGSGSDIDLSYSYIGRTRTVTAASQPMTTHHLGAGYTFKNSGTLKAYYLGIDYDDQPLWGKSTTTYGAFFDGSFMFSESSTLSYRLEYATQTDAGSNPNNVEADYMLVDAKLKMGKVTIGAGYEVLEGGPDSGAFTTPLATLHKFNGWADKFLSTPGDGLEDLYVSLGAKLGKFNLVGVYHEFTANNGGSSWGTEFDAHIIFTAPWKQKFALKYADYSADEWASDTSKLWIWTSWGF